MDWSLKLELKSNCATLEPPMKHTAWQTALTALYMAPKTLAFLRRITTVILRRQAQVTENLCFEATSTRTAEEVSRTLLRLSKTRSHCGRLPQCTRTTSKSTAEKRTTSVKYGRFTDEESKAQNQKRNTN